MKRPSAAVLLVLALSLATAGCASNPLQREDPRDQEIQDLRARLLELQRKSAMNEVEIARLRQQVAELESGRPGVGTRVSSPSALPVTQAPAAPAPSVPRSSTVAEAPRPAAPAPSRPAQTPSRPAAPAPRPSAPASVEIEEADIDLPAPKPANPAPAKPAPVQSVPRSAAEPVRPNPAPDTAPETSGPATQALYDRGYTLFHQGRFVDAEASFQRFLQANPTNELADNAQYWIGECRYSRGDMRGALAAFRETVERFPEGNKVPDALLKAGQCLEGMGDVEGARVTYREVVRRFPGTAAATVAEERRGKLP
jgi:tol-pal system protein YbgF